MLNLLNLSVLIPAVPLFTVLFIAVLLVSFSRTVNRLTKPISFFFIISFVFSTLYTILMMYKNISGEIYLKPLSLLNQDFSVRLLLNSASESSLIVVGVFSILVTYISLLRLPRRQGYVRYMTLLSSLLAIIMLALLVNPSLNVISFSL